MTAPTTDTAVSLLRNAQAIIALATEGLIADYVDRPLMVKALDDIGAKIDAAIRQLPPPDTSRDRAQLALLIEDFKPKRLDALAEG